MAHGDSQMLSVYLTARVLKHQCWSTVLDAESCTLFACVVNKHKLGRTDHVDLLASCLSKCNDQPSDDKNCHAGSFDATILAF